MTELLERGEGSIRSGLLDRYGRQGVQALQQATPKDTGRTAGSWFYRVRTGENFATLSFCNSNRNKGELVAALIQYGHGTGTGGYVPGVDYINPAMKPLFDRLSEEFRREVVGK